MTAPDFEAEARKLREQYCGHTAVIVVGNDESCWKCARDELTADIAKALQTAYAKGREDAVSVVRGWESEYGVYFQNESQVAIYKVLGNLAKAIEEHKDDE